MKEVENTIPVIPVSDPRRSIEFYTDLLGFMLDWGGAEDDSSCSVCRDGHSIMLNQQGTILVPSCVWVGCKSDREQGAARYGVSPHRCTSDVNPRDALKTTV